MLEKIDYDPILKSLNDIENGRTQEQLERIFTTLFFEQIR